MDTPNPLLLPEIVGLIIDNVDTAADLLNCACVNTLWNTAAMKKLYSGSLTDMQFRTPDITSLNCLFVASRERFIRNMSFVKHLLLLPEIPSKEAERPVSRLVSYEKCRLLSRRKDAELLFRPQGRGLASISIPFELISQGWSSTDIEDLLLPSTAEFIAIDNDYCKYLWPAQTPNPELHSQKFINLKALTVYKQLAIERVKDLCRLLKHCQLRFFHFEEGLQQTRSGGEELSFGRNSIDQLLPYVHKQKDLETLALISPQPHRNIELKRVRANAWPNLKNLYLREEPRNWLEHLPRWENLQVLTLRHIARSAGTATMESVSKCRNLRVLSLQLQSLETPEKLVEIADGCPLLRKFHVGIGLAWGEDEQNAHRDVFLDLLLVMPHIELLDLGLRFNLDDSILRALARSCPDLVSFRLCHSSLLLSPSVMSQVDPFRNLEFLRFGDLSFEAPGPEKILKSDEILTIMAEWPRMFPKLRVASFPAANCLRTHRSTVHYDRDRKEASERFLRENPHWAHIPDFASYANYLGSPHDSSDSEDLDGENVDSEGLNSEHLNSEHLNSEDLNSEDLESERAESPTLRIDDLESGDEQFDDYVEHMLIRHATEEDSQSEDLSGPAMEGIMPSIEGGGEMIDVVKDESVSPHPASTSDVPDTKTLRRLIQKYLWKNLALDCDLGFKNQWAFSRLWQMNMEVDIAGWPVVPLYAFNNPMGYSSSFKDHNASAEEYASEPTESNYNWRW